MAVVTKKAAHGLSYWAALVSVLAGCGPRERPVSRRSLGRCTTERRTTSPRSRRRETLHQIGTDLPRRARLSQRCGERWARMRGRRARFHEVRRARPHRSTAGLARELPMCARVRVTCGAASTRSMRSSSRESLRDPYRCGGRVTPRLSIRHLRVVCAPTCARPLIVVFVALTVCLRLPKHICREVRPWRIHCSAARRLTTTASYSDHERDTALHRSATGRSRSWH
jgi:hypothetical protein